MTLCAPDSYTRLVMDYAIFRTGGKQYRVSPGDILDVEKLPVETGAEIELGDVIALSEEGQMTLGTPVLEGVKVVAQVHAQAKDKKIRVLKYKRKTRYRRTLGHRQSYTRIQIVEFAKEGGES